jgi:hypothetical protein
MKLPAGLAGFLSIAVLVLPAYAQGEDASDRVDHWKQDLHFLLKGVTAHGVGVDFKHGIPTHVQGPSGGQRDFDKLYPNFNADIDTLEADLPKVDDAEIVLRLMKIMASANVGHNIVQQPVNLGFFLRIAVQFAWYTDGLAVIAAAPAYRQALGTHVVKVADKTAEEVLTDLAPYIPHEDDAGLKEGSVSMLRPMAVLKHLGLLNQDGQVVLTLRKPGGSPFQIAVRPADPRTVTVAAVDALHVRVPVSRSRTKENYWYQYLADSNAVFLQYNKCANDPNLPFHRLVNDVLAEVDRHERTRLVIDLRFNGGGGDSRIITPLKNGLEQRSDKMGPVYVLIGPDTLSAAVENAAELKSFLHAKLVGEPTAGTPASYGEVRYVQLPYSKLVIQYTTKYLGPKAGNEPTQLQPDLVVPRTLDDAMSARDPVLEAALAAR